MEIVVFKNDEWSTVGVLHPPKDGSCNSVLVMLHAGASSKTGHKSSFVKLARLASENGICAFRFDLPGDGESQIFINTLDRVKAISDAINYVVSKYKYRNVFLMGHCVGALRSLEITRRYPERIAGVILWHIVPILHNLYLAERPPHKLPIQRLKRVMSEVIRFKGNIKSMTTLASACWSLFRSMLSFPISFVRYQSKKRSGNDEKQLRNIRMPSLNKVMVIVNPSRTHYENMEQGEVFLKERLEDLGFDGPEFVQLNKKVLSLDWQTIAFGDTIRFIFECVEKKGYSVPEIKEDSLCL